MPVILAILGCIFLAAAIRGKQQLLFSTMKDDFTGPNNFWFWGIALFSIGALGYLKPVRPFANAMLVLVVLVLLLKNGDPQKNSNGGFFSNFVREMKAVSGA